MLQTYIDLLKFLLMFADTEYVISEIKENFINVKKVTMQTIKNLFSPKNPRGKEMRGRFTVLLIF